MIWSRIPEPDIRSFGEERKGKQKAKTEKKMAEIGAGTVEILKKQAEEIHEKQKIWKIRSMT